MTLFAGLAYRKTLKDFFGKGEGKGRGTRISNLHQGSTKLMQCQSVVCKMYASKHFHFPVSSKNDQAQHHDVRYS